jgi:tRNA A-37 threonylcarbamoyl transferase component Bud32
LRRVEGRFQIVREIARGGMGRVVEALDVQLGRTVALKQALDDDPEARGRFAREVEITARLEHPSIVPVYDAGESPDGEPYYVMRKVSGAPLDRLLAAATTLDERLAYLPNLLAVADAVAHAHARGVIHRDLKPANVLVGELGETVVIDWGLAKIVGEPDADGPGPVVPRRAAAGHETTAGTVLGTPGFMAPEQIRGGATDARSDVYALGACLYAVLAGTPPQAAATEPRIPDRAVRGATRRLPDVVAGVPPDLVTIVEKAMATEPAGRYLDAGGLSEELRRFLTGQLVASHRYGAGQRLVRWLRRHRALVAVSGVALAILIAVAVIAVSRIIDARERTLAALSRERERADDLIVAEASSRVDTDPTLAIATLLELRADSPRWASLGPVVAAARGRGVAVGYPGHGPGTVRVQFAPGANDSRVLTSGNGTVRLHDLARRSSTLLVESDVVYAEWAGPLIAVSGRALAPRLIDPATGAEARIDWPAEIHYLHGCGAGGAVLLGDEHGKVAAVDTSRGLPLGPPVALPVTLAATSLVTSPSGAWLIANGHTRSQLLRREAPGAMRWTVARELAGDPGAFAWDAGETRLLYSQGRDTVELDLATMTERRWAGVYAPEHGYAGARRVGLDIDGYELRWLDDDGTSRRGERVDGGQGQSLATAGDAAFVLVDRRTIAIKRDATRHVLRPPVEVTQIAVAAGGRYLIGINAAAVLGWDLETVVPARAEVPSAGHFSFVAGDLAVAVGEVGEGSLDRPVYRYQLGADPFRIAVERIGGVPAERAVVFLPAGVVVGVDPAGVVTPVTPPVPREIARISQIAGAGPDRALVGTASGEIHLVTPTESTLLATMPARVLGLAARDGWTAAVANDGTIWRRDPAGRTATVREPEAWSEIAITARGDAVFVAGEQLKRWPTSGAPVTVAPLPQGLGAIYAVAGDRVAVSTADGVLHLHDPERGTFEPVLTAATDLAFAADGSRAVARIDDGIVAVDFATGGHWTVLDRIDIGSGWLALSPDGATLLVGERTPGSPERVDRFSLAEPADLRAWVRGATNARRTVRGAIEWQSLATAPR